MRSRIHFGLVGLALSAAICRGADSTFYQVFLEAVSTNGLITNGQILPVHVTSPLLVDTNNNAFKFDGTTHTLSAMRDRGEICGIRLGMTMSEVVAKWGKPPIGMSICYGGPSFSYSDARLVFHEDSLWEVYLPSLTFAGRFARDPIVNHAGDGNTGRKRCI
jgi:hypothetical protein